MFGWLSHFKFSLSHVRDKTKNVFLLFLYQAQNLSSLIFLFRFLGEVEIFSKPLQKGLKVVHTLSELLIYTSSIIQWHVCDCLILTKGICGNKVFYGLIFLLPYWKLLKLINLVLWHLTWLTLFPGEFQLLQLLKLCACFMLSYSWPLMQLTSWGIKLHWLSINLCFLLYKIFFSPQWMLNGSNKTLLATGFCLNDKQ